MYTLSRGVAASVLFFLFGASQAGASPITYTFDLPLDNDTSINSGAGYGSGSITGTMTTDGTIGQIVASDFTSWNITVTIGSLSETVTEANSSAASTTNGPGFTATASGLFFNFYSGSGFAVYPTGKGYLFYFKPPYIGDAGGGVYGSYYGNILVGDGAFAQTFYTGPNALVEIASVTDGTDGTNTTGGTDLSSAPLPAALPLFASGFAGLGWFARRGRKHAAA